LAQQDENLLHKPLSPTEAAKLYTELKLMLAEDAARRQEATRFGSDHDPGATAGEGTGGPDSGPPSTGQGKASRQAARMVNGNASHTRLEQVSFLQRVATDGDQIPVVRKLAEVLLEEVGNGHPVDPAYRRVKAAVELVEGGHSDNSTGEPSPEQVEQLSEQAAERVHQNRARRATRTRPKPDPGKQARSSMRSFVLTWQDLDGWTDNYDPADLGPALTSEQWAMVERVFTQTAVFIEAARTARASQQSDSALTDGAQAAQRAA
jgi:ParB family chromosome partitioning protein